MKVSKIAHFTGHNGPIYSLCLGMRQHEVYSGGNDGFVVLWNLEQTGDGKLLVRVNRPVYSLLLDAKNSLLYCGTASGNLHVIDLVTQQEIRNIEAHTNGIYAICLHNEQLITGGGDGQIKVWGITNLSLLHQITQSNKSTRCLALSPDGSTIAAGYSDFSIRFFNTSNYQLQHTISAHTNSVFTVAYSPDGKELLSGGRDVMLRSWLVNDHFQMEVDIPAHTLHINRIAFNPSGNLFATVSMDKTIKVWDTEHFQLLKVIDKVRHDGHTSSINTCLWINNHQLLTGSDDRSLMLWNIQKEDSIPQEYASIN